jgi:WD40 repeat protein
MARFLLVFMLVTAHAAAQTNNVASPAPAHAEKPFPAPDFVLRDAPHKEPKSGVQLGPGGQLTIMRGVGTPTVINTLSFSRDGRVLAAGKDFGRVVLWDVQNRKFLRALETGQGIVSAVALDPDGKIVATSGKSDNFSLKLWDVATGKLLKTLREDTDFIHTLAFDAKGAWLAVSDNTGKIHVLDVATLTPTFTQAGGYFAGFSQDSTSFLTANPKEFSAWTTLDWSKKRTTPWPRPIPTIIALHSVADRMAVYQAWGVRLLRLGTGEAIEGLADILPKTSTGYPKFAAFSADGTLLFASVDDRLWVWDTKTNQTCGTPVMYSGSGAMSTDNHWLAGAKDDSILSKERTDGVWLWDLDHLLAACGIGRSMTK